MKKLCSSRQTAPLFPLLVVLFLSTPAAFAWPDLATVKTGPTTASVGDTLTYSLVSTHQAGTCCVQVSGACGDPVAACANLQVLALAQIDAGLTNQTVCLDGTAVFTVTANGTGLSYQWLHETNFLTGETNSS